MLLKVGELAKRTGITVRALHHYDTIGLLSPSARSEAGYRLYNRDDLARLHQVLALRRFGWALSEIAAFFRDPDLPLAELVGKQMAVLSGQIEQASALRARLATLQQQLARGELPTSADWLTTLEMMTVYDKYFSKEELNKLALYQPEGAIAEEWRALLADVRGLIAAAVPASDVRAQEVASRWMDAVVRGTAAQPQLFAKLNAMHEQEPALHQHTGITPAITDYIVAAFAEGRLAIYARYLDADELAFARANYARQSGQWPALIADVRNALDAGLAPTEPRARALAQRWMALFCSYAGNHPATHMKFRAAHQNEPGLRVGSWVTPDMIAFIQAASAP
ncbi:MAG: MerR family DNA-binding transcriptional regulator [Pseudomonadota bacterium]